MILYDDNNCVVLMRARSNETNGQTVDKTKGAKGENGQTAKLKSHSAQKKTSRNKDESIINMMLTTLDLPKNTKQMIPRKKEGVIKINRRRYRQIGK